MKNNKKITASLLLIVFGFTAFAYEMIIATTLSQLFGDSIYYFSLTIAFFILFMGIGSFLTNLFILNLTRFIAVEICLFFIAQFASPSIFLIAGYSRQGSLVLTISLLFTALIGIISGIEIPVFFKILQLEKGNFYFSKLLILDYVGSFVAAILFSLFLLPRFQVIGTNFFVSFLALCALSIFLFFMKKKSKALITATLLALLVTVGGLINQKNIQRRIDFELFKLTKDTEIVSSFQTQYQKVLVTSTPVYDKEIRGSNKLRQWISVYLNNYLQTQSMLDDQTDYYHHAFVHPAMLFAKTHKNILILGGGDGFPAKEVEKYPDVEKIVIVDLDAQWTRFASTDALMRKLTNNSLTHPLVELISEDAFLWVRKNKLKFDVILVDFPEGLDTALSRSYSKEFIKDLGRILSDDGIVSFEVETYLDKAFWSVVRGIKKSGFNPLIHRTVTIPDDINGLILMSKQKFELELLYTHATAFKFIQPELFIPKNELIAINQNSEIDKNIAELEDNSFFRPTFLRYYKSQWPWKITIGSGMQ